MEKPFFDPKLLAPGAAPSDEQRRLAWELMRWVLQGELDRSPRDAAWAGGLLNPDPEIRKIVAYWLTADTNLDSLGWLCKALRREWNAYTTRAMLTAIGFRVGEKLPSTLKRDVIDAMESVLRTCDVRNRCQAAMIVAECDANRKPEMAEVVEGMFGQLHYAEQWNASACVDALGRMGVCSPVLSEAIGSWSVFVRCRAAMWCMRLKCYEEAARELLLREKQRMESEPDEKIQNMIFSSLYDAGLWGE